MALLALKDLRDSVRRLMAIMPAVDASGVVGDPVSYQPDPNNNTINSCLNQAIEALNRVVRIGPFTDYTLTVSASTSSKRSAFWVDVSTLEPPASEVFHATEIQDVWWTDANGNTDRLEPYQYYSPSKGYSQFQSFEPGVPQQFITSGAQIGLLPPPATGGTLTFSACSGLDALSADTDVPTGLPDDYEFALVYFAVMLLSMREAGSVEAQTRYAQFKELAGQTFLQVYQWKNGFDDSGLEVVRNLLNMTAQNTQAQRMAASGANNGGNNG